MCVFSNKPLPERSVNCPITIRTLWAEADGKQYWNAQDLLAVLAWTQAEGGTLANARDALERFFAAEIPPVSGN